MESIQGTVRRTIRLFGATAADELAVALMVGAFFLPPALAIYGVFQDEPGRTTWLCLSGLAATLMVICLPSREIFVVPVFTSIPMGLYLFIHTLASQEKYELPEQMFTAWLLAGLVSIFLPPEVQRRELAGPAPVAPDAHEPVPEPNIDDRFAARKARYEFVDVAGMDELKSRLLKVGAEVKGSYKSRKPNEVRNGILLFGEPGNGKTFIAEALAGELGLKFIELRYGDVASKWVNQTTEGVQEAFNAAKRQAPCLLFIDEIDSFLRDRNDRMHAGGESLQTVNAMLTNLVELRNRGILLVGATNLLENLDPAAIREGRFDYKVEIPPPDLIARRAVLRSAASRRRIAIDEDALERAATRWSGFSVVRLTTITAELAEILGDRKSVPATFDQLQEALRRVQGHKGRLPEDTPTLEGIALGGVSRQRLTSIANRMRHIEEIEKLGGSVPTGLLFFGPPGTGKTLTARALARTSGWAYLATSGADLLGNPDRIDSLLADAANLRPAIVFIDEADDILAERGFGAAGAVTNKLLTAMDGSAGKVPDVVFIAATNHPESMDAAALRGGRFTEKIEFRLPERPVIEAYVKRWLESTPAPIGPDFDADLVAKLLEGQSIANIREILQGAVNRMAGRRLAGQGLGAVMLEDVDAALAEVATV